MSTFFSFIPNEAQTTSQRNSYHWDFANLSKSQFTANIYFHIQVSVELLYFIISLDFLIDSGVVVECYV